jgi:hypothetical protein
MDSIVINFSKSPELKEYFGGKEPGHKCEFTATFQVSEITGEEAKGTIDDITFYEDGDKTEVEPSAEEPAMISMEMGGEKMPMETSY